MKVRAGEAPFDGRRGRGRGPLGNRRVGATTRDLLGLSIVPGRPDGRPDRTDRVVDDARVITPNCREHVSHRDTHRLF